MTPEEEELNTATAADEEEQNTTTCTAKIIHDTDVIKTLRARASAQMAGKGVLLNAYRLNISPWSLVKELRNLLKVDLNHNKVT